MAPLNGYVAMLSKFALDQAHFAVDECGSVSALLKQTPKIVKRSIAGVNTDELDVDQDWLPTVLSNIHKDFSLVYGFKNNER